MGLDISYTVDNDEKLFDSDYITNEELHKKHDLSRTFASFMNRKNVINENEETELTQISKLINIDLSKINILDEIPSLDELEEIMEFDTEYAESQKEEYEIQIKKIENNIDDISIILSELISKLNDKEDLSKLLKPTSFDSLNNSSYFKKNNLDRDNFYKDLNNFNNFVDYAKSKGTRTIWFKYS
ncbi:hypothetical protein HZQ13_05690 [Elizabethkingia anophelis]|nr:hypothetical protein [Elizabethkingia anophelis]